MEYKLKHKSENNNVCISVNGRNLKHGDTILCDEKVVFKKDVEKQLSKEFTLESTKKGENK